MSEYPLDVRSSHHTGEDKNGFDIWDMYSKMPNGEHGSLLCLKALEHSLDMVKSLNNVNDFRKIENISNLIKFSISLTGYQASKIEWGKNSCPVRVFVEESDYIKETGSVVYFLYSDRDTRTKIGFTSTNAYKRARQITSCGYEGCGSNGWEVGAVVECMPRLLRKMESIFHNRLERYRTMNTELFDLTSLDSYKDLSSAIQEAQYIKSIRPFQAYVAISRHAPFEFKRMFSYASAYSFGKKSA